MGFTTRVFVCNISHYRLYICIPMTQVFLILQCLFVQSQHAIFAQFTSKQILPFGLAEQYFCDTFTQGLMYRHTFSEIPLLRHTTSTLLNPLTAGVAYIRVFIFYQHIKYHLSKMLHIKCDINQKYLKTFDLHFVKSE